MPVPRHRDLVRLTVLLALGILLVGGSPAAVAGPKKPQKLSFDMVVSAGAAACLSHAKAHVTIEAQGESQKMKVEVDGLPANTTFTLFVLQVPTAPFAMAWYQGDITTDHHGRGHQTFLGIFSTETFIHAPSSQPAPQTHPTVDALSNPATAPVHMYHLGIWFDDPDDADAAGCPNAVTPFNGDHHAGIRVLNTSNAGTAAADGSLGVFE